MGLFILSAPWAEINWDLISHDASQTEPVLTLGSRGEVKVLGLKCVEMVPRTRFVEVVTGRVCRFRLGTGTVLHVNSNR